MNHNEPINDKDMTKADIVSRIAEQTGVEKGIVTFLLKHRAAKTARNISKNTTMIVPAHTIPAFKPSKAFQKSIAIKS